MPLNLHNGNPRKDIDACELRDFSHEINERWDEILLALDDDAREKVVWDRMSREGLDLNDRVGFLEEYLGYYDIVV